MTKVLRLMGNEWRKEFSKVATWCMLVLLAVLTVLFAFLENITGLSDLLMLEQPFEEFCRDEIAWYEQMLAEGKDDDESLSYYQTELEAYRIMLETEMDYDDWRYEQDLARKAVEERFAGNEAAADEWMDVIRSNDTGKYFSMMKKTYEATYAGDPERLAVYTEAMDFCIAEGVVPSNVADWRYIQIGTFVQNSEIVLIQERLKASGGAWSEKTLEDARNLAAVAKYRLDNSVRINPADSFPKYGDVMMYAGSDFFYGEKETSKFWDVVASSSSLLVFVSLFSIVIAGTTVAAEFSSGSIKFLLICPAKRWKILFSKYATTLLIMLGMTALVGVLSLASAACFGLGDAFLPAVYAANGEVYTMSPYFLLLREYGYELVRTVVMLTMAFAISTLTRKSAMAIGITVLSSILGGTFSSILQLLGIDAGRYLLFSNLELKAIVEGASVYPHQSVVTAVIVILLHMAVFLLVAHDAFVRREV